MVSYAQHVQETFPANDAVDLQTQKENLDLQTKAKHHFTAKGEPGQKFRGVYDQLVKNLTVPNGVKKAFQIDKVRMDEKDPAVVKDPSQSPAQTLVRFGRYRIIPSFLAFLVSLSKEQRSDVTVVLRCFSEALLTEISDEINLFCTMHHPCYCGQFRTKKVILDGNKNSLDFRLQPPMQGKFDTHELRIEFAERNAAPPVEIVDTGDPDIPQPERDFLPTMYEGHHQIYAGLVKQIALETHMAYLHDDVPQSPDLTADGDKSHVLLVDPGDTSLSQIYVTPGTRLPCVDLRDPVDSSPLSIEDHPELFLRVDPYLAITDVEYFIKSVQEKEKEQTDKILAQKVAPVAAEAELTPEELKALPSKEYLYHTLIPALLPALHVVTRDRPADPITWLALHMLRHPKMYNKTLEAK